MGDSLPSGRNRFPQLASFIGETGNHKSIYAIHVKFAQQTPGAGKSTLIKMLIDKCTAANAAPQKPYCSYALIEFCDLYSPCEYRTKKDHCANRASTHQKGHQNAQGKIIAVGPYESKFRPDEYYSTWRKSIKNEMTKINQEIQSLLRRGGRYTEEEEALHIHSDMMGKVLADIGSAYDFLSHLTCFCCLMQTPKQKLPCGHFLCTRCIRSYSQSDSTTRSNRSILIMKRCPLHKSATQWLRPYVLRLKPDKAGVRLLSLHG